MSTDFYNGDESRRHRARSSKDYDDAQDEPRGDRDRDGTPIPCPRCGGRSLRSGSWPWYLGTLGAFLCRPVICNSCDHEFDLNSPNANLASRQLVLALVINGIGLVGIVAVLGALGFWIWYTMG